VWYAPTLMADREEDWVSPGERHAWIFNHLLAAGVYVAGVDVGESYGSPAGRAVYDRFYGLLVDRFDFSPKPGLLPISRGGLMAYNWAANQPECVGCIGGIYPLCNLAAYPPLERIAKPYGMSVAELKAQLDRHNPIDRLQPLAEARVPILHIHGDRDAVVPLQSHSAELARRYQAHGGAAEVIVVSGKGHEVVPELWQEPRLIEFFVEHVFGR
jgi:pimeloyl-ACP methyl ester carboxylesterase